MDAEEFRALVARLQEDPALLHDLLVGRAEDDRLGPLPEGRRRAVAGASVESFVRTVLRPAPDRRRVVLDVLGASCDGNVTCCCTSGTCGGVTCGGSTCDVTCSGDSCGNTCGDSCGYTTNVVTPAALGRPGRTAWR